MKKQVIQLTPFSTFGGLLPGLDLINIGTNHTARIVYLLTVETPADYREKISGVNFAKLKVNRPQTFLVYLLDEFGRERVEIPEQIWNYHHVQPLPENDLLLVCGRSRYLGDNGFDLNGRVFNNEGALKRSFLLGDGIQDVQTTADGRIWTSYFDEGVFGNFGWEHPVGSSGLIQWDKFGNQLYHYSPNHSLDAMADCYALNVVSNRETWCYYYTEFPLVRLYDEQIVESWNGAVPGSDGFALWQNHVLFRGGYRDHDQYFLYELGENGNLALKAVYEVQDEAGEKIKARLQVARGHVFYIVQDNRLYQLDLRNIL